MKPRIAIPLPHGADPEYAEMHALAYNALGNCYRKAGQPQKADDVLASMDQRVNSFRKSNDAFYWGLLTTLATLYAEGKQKEQATQKLQQMEQLLVEHPDAGRAAMLEDLRKHVWSSL